MTFIRPQHRAILYATVVGLFVLGCSSQKTETGTNLHRVEWLPESATKITYIRKFGHLWEMGYECSISPKDFETLAAQKKWPMAPKTECYTSFRKKLGLPPLRDNGIELMDYYPTALVYENAKGTGWSIQVIYDTEREVLFFHENSD